MAREDFERRRLRGMYERAKRRGDRIADLRDRRGADHDDAPAPRRYVVSENRTRLEGFGRGGTQIRRVIRESALPGRVLRFADRGIFRRGGRDRFRRDDDYDREMRRDRFRESRRGGGRRGVAREVIVIEESRGGGRQLAQQPQTRARFGGSRRLRMRVREERRRGARGGASSPNEHPHSANGDGRRRRGRRGGEGRRGDQPQQKQQQKQKQKQQPQQQKQKQGARQGKEGGRSRPAPMPTREELDAQMDRFRSS